jgi:DNA excision repair protein ERCC-2
VAEASGAPAADGQAPLVPAAPGYTVAVRALCEFTAKRGDLDLRFTPSPTGAEGVEGHGVVTARRGAGYQTEVALSGDWGPLRVRGRADGWDPVARRLEEIKTYRGDLAHVPDNHRQLHWAQARVYGALICRQLGLQQVALALVYYNIDTRQETVFAETGEAAALQAFSRSSAGTLPPGRRRRPPTGRPGTRRCARWPFRCRPFAPASANWPRRCTAPPARAAA